MFNFKLYNAALEDANLTDKEFRMLCLFLNKSSMDKSDTIEMFNGFLMDKLNLCERHIRRLTNSLEKKGYFTKTITGTVKNRNANTYTLNCTEKCDKNVPPCNIKDEDKNVNIKCDKNVPPYKEHINNNKKYNISKDFSTYGNSTCREKDITKWTKVSNENNNFKENEMSDNGTSVMNAKRNEVERNEDKFKEDIISKAIGNINLDKSSMFEAKSQMEYDAALEDLKLQLKKIQDNTSTEAYNNFRSQLGKWFNASKPYMKFAPSKKKKVNAAPAPTDEEKGKLEWFVEGVKVSKSVEEVDKNFNKIDQMFEILYGKYPQNSVDKLYERTTDRLSEYKKNNPIVAEYIKNVTGEPQTVGVDKLSTNEEKTRQNASKYPQIEEESNMDMCCETKVA